MSVKKTRLTNKSLLILGVVPALIVPSISANDINLLFVVDESGSMGGEHQFLQDQAPSIASGLSASGASNVNFGLIGYGNSSRVPHLFDVGSGLLGTAAEFSTAAGNLITSGSFEDGYAGIDFATDSYSNLTGSTFTILITDEDRDVLSDAQYPGASQLDATSMQQSLAAFNSTLISILDQEILDADGNTALVINSRDQVYEADGQGDAIRTENGELGSGRDGDIRSDYADLAIETGGIVADLQQLREGGLTADSFTLAFIDSLIDIILISTGGDLSLLAENSNQRSIATLVVSSSGSGSDQQFFQNALTLTPSQKRLLLRLAELQGMLQVGNTLIGGAHTYSFVMDDHFSVTARESRRQIDAGDYAQRPKWNSFFQFVANDAQIDSTSTSVSGDSENYSGFAGFDYRWSSELVTGIAVGYKDDDIDYSNQSSSSIDTTSFMAYSAWSPTRDLSLEGTIGYSHSDIDTFRRTTALGTPTDARGDTEAETLSASLGIRYNMDVSQFTITPYARLQWARVNVDGYTEQGGGALSAVVNSYDIDSLQSILGLKAETELPIADYRLLPYISAEYIHEFEDNGAFVDTRLAGQTLRLETDAPDADYGRISLGTTFELSRSTAIVASLNQSIGNQFIDTTSFRLSLHHSF